jgi:hypothetical protein
MEISGDIFMGIDLSGQRNGLTCAILDNALRIVFNGSLSPMEWQSILQGCNRVTAAVNSPLTLNLGYMEDDEYRQQLARIPLKNRYKDMRVCEYELTLRGLTPTRTPKNVARFSVSQQKALKFSSEMGMNGFQFWPNPGVNRQMMEINADASYWSMLGLKPFASTSLEGRIQRQLVLQSRKLSVKDAMIFFEEVTRHRLLSGKLPDEMILSTSLLNALVAAYTAWVVANRPGESAQFGEPDEGFIFLPCKPSAREESD